MTGFSSLTAEHDGYEIVLEIKTVNSRFLDINCRMPQSFSSIENPFKNKIKEKLERGRVDLYLSSQNKNERTLKLELNKESLEEYLNVAKSVLGGDFKKKQSEIILGALDRKEILSYVTTDERIEIDQDFYLSLLDKALDQLLVMRNAEGQALANVLSALHSQLEEALSRIKEQLSNQQERLHERLQERVSKIISDSEIDPQRIAQEVAIQVDKADVTEELVRLAVHLKEFKTHMKSVPAGKKLEFLLQEMLREVNTIGSKCQDAEIATEVVTAKSVLEKMKEQIANVV